MTIYEKLDNLVKLEMECAISSDNKAKKIRFLKSAKNYIGTGYMLDIIGTEMFCTINTMINNCIIRVIEEY